jgi:hypothetical protein
MRWPEALRWLGLVQGSEVLAKCLPGGGRADVGQAV